VVRGEVLVNYAAAKAVGAGNSVRAPTGHATPQWPLRRHLRRDGKPKDLDHHLRNGQSRRGSAVSNLPAHYLWGVKTRSRPWPAVSCWPVRGRIVASRGWCRTS